MVQLGTVLIVSSNQKCYSEWSRLSHTCQFSSLVSVSEREREELTMEASSSFAPSPNLSARSATA